MKERGSRSGRSKKSRALSGRKRAPKTASQTSTPRGRESGSGTHPSDKITLEDELASPDFAEHGKARALVLASYLASLVDDRSTGTLATGDRKVYERVVGFASSMKAAACWFFGEPDAQAPDFVTLAEHYLANRALNRDDPDEARRIVEPPPGTEHRVPRLVPGPVVSRKGGHGKSGRVHAVQEHKRVFVELLERLDQRDLEVHLRAFQDPQAPRPSEKWILPKAIAENMLVELTRGAFPQLLREQDFHWPEPDPLLQTLAAAARRVLKQADLTQAPRALREARLDELAENLMRAMLGALDIKVDADFFRDRTAERRARG